MGTDANTSNTTSYTFSSKDLGTPAVNRKVIVGVFIPDDGDVTSTGVTIGGVTAVNVEQTSIGSSYGGLFYADVPSGATGDIVVTPDASALGCHIGYWVAYMSDVTPAVEASENFLFPTTVNWSYTASTGFSVMMLCVDSGDTTDRSFSVDSGYTTFTEIFSEANSAFTDKLTTAGTENPTVTCATFTDSCRIFYANWAAP